MTFEIKIDVSQLGGLAERLSMLDGETLGRAAVEAVNAVTLRFDKEQRAGQTRDIALSSGYVDSKTRVDLASSPTDAEARITTAGDLTVMDRYPLKSLSDPNRLDRRGHKLGKRQAGVEVTIRPSAPQSEPQWFLMRLRNNEGRQGVFVRTSAGKTKHMYGPSPYSLFRFQVRTGEEGLLQDLENTGVAAIADAVEKALA